MPSGPSPYAFSKYTVMSYERFQNVSKDPSLTAHAVFLVFPLLAACGLFSAGTAKGQATVKSFDGDRGPGAAVCDTGVMHCILPEMDVSANGKVVVQVTWQNVRVYDYNGRLLQSTPMTSFIRSAGLDLDYRPSTAECARADRPGAYRAARGLRRVHRPLDHHHHRAE